ncbi:hypothetical protein PIB30_042974 [Stylosanthes scabra]|uniref:Uncharacterized protein n=1 Tax=Stylosanthes scabra TaxID=79078 RepID=A0ABU6RG46_9FABA|nr:hypothetical protein [Stylosanthes scabra]
MAQRLGTANYMAPEQWEPEIRGPISFETDFTLDELANDGGWRYLGNVKTTAKSSSTGYTEWFLSKDPLHVRDTVRSRKPSNSCTSQNMDVPSGTVVGLERNPDNGFVLVRVHGIQDPIRVHASTIEHVTFGLAAGNWV